MSTVFDHVADMGSNPLPNWHPMARLPAAQVQALFTVLRQFPLITQFLCALARTGVHAADLITILDWAAVPCLDLFDGLGQLLQGPPPPALVKYRLQAYPADPGNPALPVFYWEKQG
jgi:hypothetical protein